MASDELEELQHKQRVIRAWIEKYAEWRRSEPDERERHNLQRRLEDLQSRERRLVAEISWHRSVRRISKLEQTLSSPAADSFPLVLPHLNLSPRQTLEKLLQVEKENKTRQAKIFQNALEMPLWNRVFHDFPKKWMTPESVEMGYLVPWSATEANPVIEMAQPPSGQVLPTDPPPTPDTVMPPAASDQKQRDVPPPLSAQLALGKWADEMLDEAELIIGALRGGELESALRPRYPRFFEQLVDELGPESRERLLKQAKTTGISKEILFDYLREVKGGIAASTLAGYRKDYRNYLKEERRSKAGADDSERL